MTWSCTTVCSVWDMLLLSTYPLWLAYTVHATNGYGVSTVLHTSQVRVKVGTWQYALLWKKQFPLHSPECTWQWSLALWSHALLGFGLWWRMVEPPGSTKMVEGWLEDGWTPWFNHLSRQVVPLDGWTHHLKCQCSIAIHTMWQQHNHPAGQRDIHFNF